MHNVQHIVADFIATIWNDRRLEELDRFLHPDFTDHSLPPSLTPDAAGLQNWVRTTSEAFDHRTIIDDQVTEGDKSVVRVRMEMTHIGEWRGIPATGIAATTRGYRQFRIADGKIIEQWDLIDGATLENQLRNTTHGCAPQK